MYGVASTRIGIITRDMFDFTEESLEPTFRKSFNYLLEGYKALLQVQQRLYDLEKWERILQRYPSMKNYENYIYENNIIDISDRSGGSHDDPNSWKYKPPNFDLLTQVCLRRACGFRFGSRRVLSKY